MVSGMLGGLTGDQMLTRIVLYQILGQLVGGALGPYWRELEQVINARTPNAALSPIELAALVERSYMDLGTAAAEAAKSGINGERFAELVKLQENAPPPEWLAIAYRRGIIPEDGGSGESVGFMQGIAQGPIAVKWAAAIKAMAVNLPSPEMALEALLEGQTDAGTAKRLYREWGGDDQYFDLLFNTRGSAPTPLQAIEMANRGVIPWEGEGSGSTSFHQAFLEGPWRNKWEAPFRELGNYVPPPRTVTAMVRDGSLTDEQALAAFRKQGMSAELAAAYLKSAHHQKTSAVHELARSTLQELYADRIISRADLIAALTAQDWSAEDAELLAEVVDVRREQSALNALVNRLHALFIGHKITEQTARGSLSRVGIPSERQDDILELWRMERDANAKDLTPAQIEAALFYKVLTQDEAQRLLELQGYTPHDAWVALSVRMHAVLPGEPPRDALPGGN